MVEAEGALLVVRHTERTCFPPYVPGLQQLLLGHFILDHTEDVSENALICKFFFQNSLASLVGFNLGRGLGYTAAWSDCQKDSHAFLICPTSNHEAKAKSAFYLVLLCHCCFYIAPRGSAAINSTKHGVANAWHLQLLLQLLFTHHIFKAGKQVEGKSPQSVFRGRMLNAAVRVNYLSKQRAVAHTLRHGVRLPELQGCAQCT